MKKSCICVQICVQYGERSKGPLVTSLAGIGTSGGPAAPLVNMLLLSGPQQHTPRYHMHAHTQVHADKHTYIWTQKSQAHGRHAYRCASFLGHSCPGLT